jgi:hypothetical protein
MEFGTTAIPTRNPVFLYAWEITTKTSNPPKDGDGRKIQWAMQTGRSGGG